MPNTNNKPIHRRSFLKLFSLATVGGASLLTGCSKAYKGELSQGVTYIGDIPKDKMTYRTNPSTGDRVSLLGYGCMRWPTLEENGKQVIDQEQVNQLVDYAIEHGMNYFDTAPVYVQGLSETATGIALSRHERSSYFIATKMSNHRIAGQGLTPEELFKESKAMYEQSLKALQVNYIDYYLLHSVGGGSGLPFLMERFFDNHLIDFLVEERKAGRIRNLGWSFHGDVKVFDYLLQLHDEGKYKWDFVQIQMNYLDWHHAKEINPRNVNAEYLYSELAKRNIPAIIMEPLLGGRLSNVPEHIALRLKKKLPEKSIASWAFRFCGTYPNTLSILSGMTYMEHLQDNLLSFSPLVNLSQEDLDYLEETSSLMAAYPTIPCNDCNYCMPCKYGLDIPGIFVHYNKCINEGNIPENKTDKNYSKARRAFLISYDRSVPKLRQANHCINCGLCTPKCPQNIRIPEQMNKINNYVEQLKQGLL